ncbi:MAG: hypothetical protein ACKO9Q_18435, partial [Pirellula sp.]
LGMAFTILDNIRDVQLWYKRTIVGDFFVRAAMPDMSSGHAADMPDGFAEKVAAVDGILVSDTMRFVSARAGELSVIVIVRQFNSKTQDYFDLVQGQEDQVMQGIREGKVVLGSVLAERSQLSVGDLLELETTEGKVKVDPAQRRGRRNSLGIASVLWTAYDVTDRQEPVPRYASLADSSRRHITNRRRARQRT